MFKYLRRHVFPYNVHFFSSLLGDPFWSISTHKFSVYALDGKYDDFTFKLVSYIVDCLWKKQIQIGKFSQIHYYLSFYGISV